ncbi:MAG: hypothetical protein RLY71_1186 [Pseudomonadota bacterium]|jgi:hypothetical protein
MRKYGYLVVEGPHDVEFCYRLLSAAGLKRIQHLKDLDPSLDSLVPRSFPHGGDLLKRVPVPLFLQNEQCAIAIHSAVGDSRLVATLQETVEVLGADIFTGLGVMLDSDSDKAATERYDTLRQAVMQELGLSMPDQAGTVSVGPPRLGAFVLPDNLNKGTLEDLLLESAALQYPALLPVAADYVNTAWNTGLIPNDHQDDIRKPAGRNKAVMGAMASLFKPGKAVQTSIQDNAWLRGQALEIKRIKAVQVFLAQLFELH